MKEVEKNRKINIYLNLQMLKNWIISGAVTAEQCISAIDEMIKAQEPRMLTAVEYKEWCVGNRKTPLLIERRRTWKNKHEMYWTNIPEGVIHIDEEYEKSFVAWTGWPSDAQQKAVHWREIDALKMEVDVPKIGVKTRHISEKYQSGGHDDWSGAQGNDGERIKEQAKRSEWGIYG